MELKSFYAAQQLTSDDIFEIFNLADEIRNNPKNYSSSLKGKVLATLFYEPSTRTRLSFETAMLRLGGGVISTENAKEFSSAIKGESIEDTARVIEGYADCIVLRHHEEGSVKKAADVSKIPCASVMLAGILNSFISWMAISRYLSMYSSLEIFGAD
jgi:aspartate carbamoyltransferase catalytic subunit